MTFLEFPASKVMQPWKEDLNVIKSYVIFKFGKLRSLIIFHSLLDFIS